MIIPLHCKVVGYASSRPCGDSVYFLTRYLVRETTEGHEVVEVELDPSAGGMMRPVVGEKVLAKAGEVMWHPEKVHLADRTHLINLALAGGARCTIFTGLDEHVTFVLDPDPGALARVHVYDITPPRPSLSATIRDLEICGLFGGLGVVFEHHISDITALDADVYPCHAAGFERTLDTHTLSGSERIAGCQTGAQIYHECYGGDAGFVDICPLRAVEEEPFIARCCRSEREGIGEYGGRFGAVVHWGADPWTIAASVHRLIEEWGDHDHDRDR